MAKRHKGGYARTPWCMLDQNLADELTEVATWAATTLRADSARSCVSAALHLAPHVRPGRDGEPPAARVTCRELAGECHASASATARALRRLVGAGFLVATPAPLGATAYTFACHLPEAERPRAAKPEASPREARSHEREAEAETGGATPWLDAAGRFRPLSDREQMNLPKDKLADYERAEYEHRILGV